jgi:hypothetical protein
MRLGQADPFDRPCRFNLAIGLDAPQTRDSPPAQGSRRTASMRVAEAGPQFHASQSRNATIRTSIRTLSPAAVRAIQTVLRGFQTATS